MNAVGRQLKKRPADKATALAADPCAPVPIDDELSQRYGTPPAAPSVTLYINGSEESRRVFQMLESADVDFRAVSSRRQTPTATLGGRRFSGPSGVRRLIELLQELETVWRDAVDQSMPALFQLSDPAAMERLHRHRECWRREARAVLTHVQAATATRGQQSAPRDGAPRR
jgi:hypothetical protein